jgi:methylase of polypeptide subunit release factors
MHQLEVKDKIFFINELFLDQITQGSSFKIYRSDEIINYNKVFKDIKTGKFIIITNSKKPFADKIYKEIVKRIDELIPFEELQRINSKDFSRNRKREYDRIKNDIFNRLLVISKNDRLISFDEEIYMPYLSSFCGDDPNPVQNDTEYLLPYNFYLELENSLKESIEIRALKMNISTGVNVLLPKSQETTGLFKSAFEELTVKKGKKIIDMGCGSGVLTLLADDLFEDSEIYFSDILPEALASTLRNIENNRDVNFLRTEGKLSCLTQKNSIRCLGSGDLFEHTEDKYDIIIFNPPWIDAVSNNRSELALNDKNQKTLERFLMQAKRRLTDKGKIFLAFSDNSGDQAVDKFKDLIAQNEFIAEKEFSCKIQSHQSGRKWMRIFVNILAR